MGSFACFYVICLLFQNNWFENSFRNTTRVSSGFKRSVGPDLGPNCLQRLSGDDM